MKKKHNMKGKKKGRKKKSSKTRKRKNKTKYQRKKKKKKMAIYCPQGSGTLRQQLLIMHGIAWYCMVLHCIA